MKIQNINLFITACTTVFGLKPVDMFTAEELYYASNFAKVDLHPNPSWCSRAHAQVVTVISLLSKTPAATSSGFQFVA